MITQGQTRAAIATALACAAIERRNGLKRQARKWVQIARFRRWCPYHQAFDALAPLPEAA